MVNTMCPKGHPVKGMPNPSGKMGCRCGELFTVPKETKNTSVKRTSSPEEKSK